MSVAEGFASAPQSGGTECRAGRKGILVCSLLSVLTRVPGLANRKAGVAVLDLDDSRDSKFHTASKRRRKQLRFRRASVLFSRFHVFRWSGVFSRQLTGRFSEKRSLLVASFSGFTGVVLLRSFSGPPASKPLPPATFVNFLLV